MSWLLKSKLWIQIKKMFSLNYTCKSWILSCSEITCKVPNITNTNALITYIVPTLTFIWGHCWSCEEDEEDAGTRTAEHCGPFLRKLSKNLFDVLTKIQQKISFNLTYMTKSSWNNKKKERKEETVRDYCP